MMRKEFIQLSVPNILTNLTVPLVSLVDVALMGRMPSVDYIIAIGLATTLFNLIYFAFGFLRMGTTGLVSQAYGRNEPEKMKDLFVQGMIVSFCISLLLICFQNQLIELGLWFFEVDEITEQLIRNYFGIRIWAAPATISLFVIIGWLLGVQDSKLTLLLAIIINLSNAIISYFLVWQLNLEIVGVAYGTVIAQYTGLITGLLILKLKYQFSIFKFYSRIRFTTKAWKEFFMVNKNIFIRTLCLLFTLSFFKIQSVNHGGIIGAVNLLLLEFVMLSAYGIDGLAFAAESLTGKYFGMKNLELLKRSIRVSVRYGLGLGFLISGLFYLFGESILKLLTDKQAIIELAVVYMPWLIIAPIINALAFIWDGVYIGCTATQAMKWTLLISTFVIFLPSFYLFKLFFGNHGIWLSMTLFMLSRGILQTLWAQRYIYGRLSS
ncbi:MAG: MATE family efflux transporter [Flavobacteriales bacterium]|nr:MATE family efflux transporter [Flavobacteriales bacterium]